MPPQPLLAAARRLATAEIVLAIGAFHLCTWALAPHVGDPAMARIFLGMLAALTVYPLAISARAWKHLGADASIRIHWPGLTECVRDIRVYAPLTLAASIAVLLLSLGTNRGWQDVNSERLAIGLLRYLGLASVQVYFYFVFILPRLIIALQSTNPKDHRVWAILAAIFAFCHLPNPSLMALGALIAIGWTWLYRHRPNPVLLCASHAILGTLLAEVAQIHMRIGVAYSIPGFRPFRVALASVLMP